jgi:O-antigen/teichoic acid export membrane protein
MNSLDRVLAGVAKSALIVFFGTAVGKVLALLAQVLIVRSLSPALFGHVALAYTVVSTTGGLALLGVNEGVTRLMSAKEDANYRRRILRAGYLFALLGGFAAVIAIYTLRFRLGTYLNDERLPDLLIAFLPFLIAYTISSISFGALRAYKRSIPGVIARDLGPRLGALLFFGLFVLAEKAVLAAILYWLMTPVIMAILTSYYLRREVSIKRVFSKFPDRETIHDLWSFSWPLALSASFFLLLSNIDILMIGYFLEPQSVGFYRSIQPLRQITTFVIVGFGFLFVPTVTKYYENNEYDALEQIYTITTKWIIWATFPPVIMLSLFASDVVNILFGIEYIPAAPALSVLTAGLFLRAAVGLNGDITKSINRPKVEFYSVVPGVFVNVGINLLFIPRYGIIGAAIGTVAGYGTYNILEVAAIYRIVGIHPFSANAFKPLIPVSVFALGLTRMAGDSNLSFPLLITIGIVISFIHLVSIVLTRSLNTTDLVLFKRFEKRTGLELDWIKSIIRRDQ